MPPNPKSKADVYPKAFCKISELDCRIGSLPNAERQEHCDPSRQPMIDGLGLKVQSSGVGI